LKFCDKEPTDEEMIEKTLSTMLPVDRLLQQQFRQHNFQVYSELIQILIQAEKYDELLVKNHHRLPIGAAPPPMPEVNYTVQNNNKFDGSTSSNPKNSQCRQKRNNKQKSSAPTRNYNNRSSPYDKTIVCHKCGCYKLKAKQCRTPKHLVDLYQKYGRGRQAKEPRLEAHFNLPSLAKEASCSQQLPQEPSNNLTNHPQGDFVEYASRDVFGDMD